MPEIRIKVSDKLDSLINSLSEKLGVAKTEYVKSLILKDLRGEEVMEQKNKKQ